MQDGAVPSGSSLPVAPPKPASLRHRSFDSYIELSFPPAAPNQILRAYQRDQSHVQRLSDLVSELVRTAAGSRWLARRQIVIDVAAKTVYLALTLGRSLPTFGEEYTDIAPHAKSEGRVSRLRRLLAILLLVIPSVVTSSSLFAWSRLYEAEPVADSWISRLRYWLSQLTGSSLGQALPEISTIAFLYSGTFLEFGRRVAGIPYISTTSPRSSSTAGAYEPLSLILGLPLLYRLVPWPCVRSDVRQPLASMHITGPPLADHNAKTNSKPVVRDNRPSNTYLATDARNRSERQCTLCLEPRGSGEGSRGSVAVTECGHAFCWGCLANLDKAECPLCRQTLRMERLIVGYNL